MKTDWDLQKDVMEELKHEPQLKGITTDIGVIAKDGVVTLSGIVDTYLNKIVAENAAQRVAGVKVVAVDLEVKSDITYAKNDYEIATAVKNALAWQSAVNGGCIQVSVEDGWVYLKGTVEWEYMKKAVEKSVSEMIGVKGVINNILVKGNIINPVEIKRKINAAFHRSATIDASNIQIEVIGNQITLSGKVRTWAERDEAESTAWCVPGIALVNNRIKIDSGILVK